MNASFHFQISCFMAYTIDGTIRVLSMVEVVDHMYLKYSESPGLTLLAGVKLLTDKLLKDGTTCTVILVQIHFNNRTRF